jgi:hypothetical protein
LSILIVVEFQKHLPAGTLTMNLRYARLRLAVRSMTATSLVRMSDQDAPKSANDNLLAWPYVPFPFGWYASN